MTNHDASSTLAIDDSREESLMALGQRIRQTRRGMQLTLQDLADATGLSVSMLSLVERGRTSPSIGSLVVIASALQVPVAELVAGIDAQREGHVVRHEDQSLVALWPGVSRRTATLDRQRHIEISVNEWDPIAETEPQPARHEGYEYGLVIEGQLTVDVGDSTYVLNPGDLVSYPSEVLHSLRSSGGSTTRAIWVNVGSF